MTKRLLISLATFAFSASLVGYIISQFPLTKLLNTFSLIGTLWILPVFFILIFMTLAHVTRWLIMGKILIPTISKYHLTLNIFIGMIFQQTLPVGGDAARVVHLLKHKAPLTLSLITLLFDRAFAFTALFAIAVLFFFLEIFNNPLSPLALSLHHLFPLIALASLAFIISSLALVFSAHRIFPLFENRKNPFATLLYRAFYGLYLFSQHPLRISLCFLCALAVQFFTCLIPLIVISLAGWNLQPFALFASVATVLVIAYLPISLAGWGIRETGFVVIAPYIGILDSQALVVALILGTSQLIQGVTCGAFLSLSNLFPQKFIPPHHSPPPRT